MPTFLSPKAIGQKALSRNARPATSADHPHAPTPPVNPRPDGGLITAALYDDGHRVDTLHTVAESADRLADRSTGFAWIGLYRPEDEVLEELGEQFGLHPLAIEDARDAHQRPKAERYGSTLFVVLRAARYVDSAEQVEFSELHVFIGTNFVITVRHGEVPVLAKVRARMEDNPDLLARGPEAVLYAILDTVVDGYAPIVAGVQNDIDEIETEVFTSAPDVSRRIYELSREVVEFQRATRPLTAILSSLSAGSEKYGIDAELQRYLRDVADHAAHTIDDVGGFRLALQDILRVNATLVGQRQNEEMKALAEAGHRQNEEIKRISAWAAILFAPTLVGTIYGMNFETMPELQWAAGYPFALSLMLLVCVGLFATFKRNNWL
ncbi:magnesium and cobalt transport protein CorA [Gordonia sinesedis]